MFEDLAKADFRPGGRAALPRGCVSLHHRGRRCSSDCKFAALTAVHNCHLRCTDGTTAAERFFGHAPESLSEQAIERVPLSPATAAREAPSAKDRLSHASRSLNAVARITNKARSTRSSGRRWRCGAVSWSR